MLTKRIKGLLVKGARGGELTWEDIHELLPVLSREDFGGNLGRTIVGVIEAQAGKQDDDVKGYWGSIPEWVIPYINLKKVDIECVKGKLWDGRVPVNLFRDNLSGKYLHGDVYGLNRVKGRLVMGYIIKPYLLANKLLTDGESTEIRTLLSELDVGDLLYIQRRMVNMSRFIGLPVPKGVSDKEYYRGMDVHDQIVRLLISVLDKLPREESTSGFILRDLRGKIKPHFIGWDITVDEIAGCIRLGEVSNVVKHYGLSYNQLSEVSMYGLHELDWQMWETSYLTALLDEVDQVAIRLRDGGL